MTEEQKNAIALLRKSGAGYGKISKELGISENTIKSYCRRNRSVTKLRQGEHICPMCGKPVMQNPGRREKKFCSDACRRKWWNENRDKVRQGAGSIYGFTCKRCGKEFTAYGNPHRQYCSHECYVSDRFWEGEEPVKAMDIDLSKTPTVVLLNS